ncbi:cell division cycle-associated protein 4 [Trichomycterus rosablanca]|uniref:cell division cycle-associated protein 4 n=1 Tax=Trichomycterus rosablanca TaxID=2290929 RepID=UPI002F34F8A5
MGQRDFVSLKASMKSKKVFYNVSMCRLNLDPAVLKKEVESEQGDALSSERFMLGHGVKRKLSECEDPVLDLPYSQQRQLVLDLCLEKLQSCQRHAEPSLHRSVLLTNTLRQIQQEMQLEGGTCLPRSTTAPSLFPPATPRHIPELPPVSVDCSSLAAEAPPLSSSLTPDEDEVQKRCAESKPLHSSLSDEINPKQSDLLFGSFEITNSTSYLSDLPLDDIFEDIDTSMCDSSDISVFAFPAARGSVVASAAGEDGNKSFSCTSNGALQICFSDLNDLDHIMEILVRS